MEMNAHGGEIREGIEYDFSVNINPLGMHPEIKKAVDCAIRSCDKYPDRLSLELCAAIADKEGIDASQVICGNGVSELIMAIAGYVSQGQKDWKAYIPAPTFSGYARAVMAYGGETAPEMENVRTAFICNPNNPTGEMLSAQDIEQIVKRAADRDILVVIDESFIDFTDGESAVRLIEKYDNVIVLKAFTKFFAIPGIRLGYAMANRKVVEEIRSMLPEWNISCIAQAAGVAALNIYAEIKEKTRLLINNEREYLIHSLTEMGIKCFNSRCNFILCKSDDIKYSRELLKYGILVRDCSNFEGLDSSYFRICVGNHTANQALISAINSIC